MGRCFVGTAIFSVALSVASCSGSGAKHGAETMPQPAVETSVPVTRVPQPLSEGRLLEILGIKQRSFNSMVSDPAQSEIRGRVAWGICAVISNIKTGETEIIINPESIDASQPDNSGRIQTLAGYFAAEHRSIFGPAMSLADPAGLIPGGSRNSNLSRDVELKLVYGPNEEQDEDILAVRTPKGTFVDAAQPSRTVFSVRASANIDPAFLDEFVASPDVQGVCKEAWTGVQFQPAPGSQLTSARS